MRKIRIAGAGPSGLTAAINLAKAGYEVDVFEKAPDVGKHLKGGLQGLENWSDKRDISEELREMNLETNFDLDPFYNFTVSNGMKSWDFEADPGTPAFYLVKRGSVPGSLDYGLKEQALQSGVNIRFQEKAPLDKVDIIATGPVKNEVFIAAKGIAFDTSMNDMAIAFVDDRAAYLGYSYLLVTNGSGCMCTVLFDRFNNVGDCLENTKRVFSEMVELDIRNPRPDGGIGSFSLDCHFESNGQLYVGEAAGLQDMVWGFGMRSAMRSGYLAARSIIHGEDYEKAATECFRNKLKASLVNRYIWERFGARNYSMIFDALKGTRNPPKYMQSFHNFNYLQRVAYPFAIRKMRDRYPELRL
ncbi:NAD(P)/FAD-dependent oxidoreductase [Methanococcoides sp. FTZ1]|uniref:NAD(P)/FAD-dependent oxidoreductase n=1 Tax=Methanococcoides sp. FTZ1 TaxID=3439061 RepID=UPI003F85C2FB